MNDNNQDFEALRRLLALKRHEVPPPGYFEDFSSNVIARIRASEAVRRTPWLLRLLQAFESRPAYPVSFASALCLLLLFGIVSVQQNPQVVQVFGSSPTSFPVATTGGTALDMNQSLVDVTTNPPMDLSGSTAFGGSPSSAPSFPQTGFSLQGN